jgi:uncharacterized protein (TIGR02246 family)
MKKVLFLTAFAVMLTISANVAFAQNPASKQSKDEKEIRTRFESTAVGWNKGDLGQYLAVYTKDATEMRRTGPAGGVEEIEKTMRGGFWKTGRPLQTLRYENVVVRMLGSKGALVTGQFILSGGGQADRTGWFTSVWAKTKDGWKMIHDHS